MCDMWRSIILLPVWRGRFPLPMCWSRCGKTYYSYYSYYRRFWKHKRNRVDCCRSLHSIDLLITLSLFSISSFFPVYFVPFCIASEQLFFGIWRENAASCSGNCATVGGGSPGKFGRWQRVPPTVQSASSQEQEGKHCCGSTNLQPRQVRWFLIDVWKNEWSRWSFYFFNLFLRAWTCYRFDNCQELGEWSPTSPWGKLQRSLHHKMQAFREWHPSVRPLIMSFLMTTFPIMKWLPRYNVKKLLVKDLISG